MHSDFSLNNIPSKKWSHEKTRPGNNINKKSHYEYENIIATPCYGETWEISSWEFRASSNEPALAASPPGWTQTVEVRRL